MNGKIVNGTGGMFGILLLAERQAEKGQTMIRYFNDRKHGHSFNVAHDAILMLAQSQGFYSRMKEDMENQRWEPLFELTKNNYFDTMLDFILFVEC